MPNENQVSLYSFGIGHWAFGISPHTHGWIRTTTDAFNRRALYRLSYMGNKPREKESNLQLPGSEPGVLPVELSLKCFADPFIRNSTFAIGHFPPLGERLDSNQQPEAYEAPALPLSYAPNRPA